MNIYVNVGGSEALTLRGALLVYQGKSRSFVAWHEARNAEQGAPFLGEAQPLTTEFVHGLAQGLARASGAGGRDRRQELRFSRPDLGSGGQGFSGLRHRPATRPTLMLTNIPFL